MEMMEIFENKTTMLSKKNKQIFIYKNLEKKIPVINIFSYQTLKEIFEKHFLKFITRVAIFQHITVLICQFFTTFVYQQIPATPM